MERDREVIERKKDKSYERSHSCLSAYCQVTKSRVAIVFISDWLGACLFFIGTSLKKSNQQKLAGRRPAYETRAKSQTKIKARSRAPLREPLVRGQLSSLFTPPLLLRLFPPLLAAKPPPPRVRLALLFSFPLSRPLFSLPKFPTSRTGGSSPRFPIDRVGAESIFAQFALQKVHEQLRLGKSAREELSHAEETRDRALLLHLFFLFPRVRGGEKFCFAI